MEQPSQRIQPAHHEHHYKRSVIIAAVILGSIVIAAIIYQLVHTDVGGLKEEKLREQYNIQQIRAGQEAYKKLEEASKASLTDADKKAFEAFLKASASAPKSNPEQSAAQYQQLQQESEAAFQAWKANR
jgi:uncharacterized membrane protein YhiD involved in acid resistance